MIVVATTLAAFVMDQPDTWQAWLRNHQAIRSSHPDVRYFAALDVDCLNGSGTSGHMLGLLQTAGLKSSVAGAVTDTSPTAPPFA